MEIEGIINHTLAAALVERDYIAKRVVDNKQHIQFWKNLQKIHANEFLQAKLENITHIRQILGSEEFMEYLIKQDVDAEIEFMGFSIKAIEFYLHLRDSIKIKEEPIEHE